MTEGTGHDEGQTAPIPDATVAPPEPAAAPTEPISTEPIPSAPAAASEPGGWQRFRTAVINPENRWFLPVVGLVAYLLLLLTNFLADWLPFNDRTTSAVVSSDPIALQPASWAFSIWLLIAVLLGGFVVLSLTPVGQRDVQVRRIVGFFVVACVATILWQFFWHWERHLLALIVAVVMWGALMVITILGRRSPSEGRLKSLWQKLMVQLPFSVALGWASVLMLLSFALWADRDWGTGNPFSDRAWAVILMLIGVVIAAAFALFARDSVVPLVFLWFFVAVVQEQWDDSTLVVVVAVVAAIASSALALVAYSLRFNPDALGRLTARRRSTVPPAVPPPVP